MCASTRSKSLSKMMRIIPSDPIAISRPRRRLNLTASCWLIYIWFRQWSGKKLNRRFVSMRVCRVCKFSQLSFLLFSLTIFGCRSGHLRISDPVLGRLHFVMFRKAHGFGKGHVFFTCVVSTKVSSVLCCKVCKLKATLFGDGSSEKQYP